MQLFVTRRCQLRCRYCPVVKRDADMSARTMRRAVDLLMTHRSPRLRLDFGGGEPLLRLDLLREALDYASGRARKSGKEISFYMVTNGIALGEGALEALAGRDVFLEISLDGDARSHNRYKKPYRGPNAVPKGAGHGRAPRSRPRQPVLDPYKAARRGLEAAVRSGLPHTVVLVAGPANCARLVENVRHIAGLGVRRIEINYALGLPWKEPDIRTLLSQVERLAEVFRGPMLSGDLVLGNLRGRVEPALLNAELMVDTDGTLHLMSEWMFETKRPSGGIVYSYGDVSRVKDINPLYWSRFHSYYTLVNLYRGDPAVRRIMLNNIRLGERVRRTFEDIGARLHAGKR